MSQPCFIGIIVASLLTVSCAKKIATGENDLLKSKLTGPVKSISETNYSNNGKFATVIKFDREGYIKEQSEYNSDGSMIRKWKNVYNAHHQKVRRFIYVGNDSLSAVLWNTYNACNLLSDERMQNTKGKLISLTVHEYDCNCNETVRRFIGDSNVINGQIEYTYDKRNHLVIEESSNYIFHQYRKQKYSYQADGQIAERAVYSQNDSLVERVTYDYINNERLGIMKTYSNTDDLISQTTFRYLYDGNISCKIIEKPEKTIYKYEYDYDRYKNWITQKTFLDDKPVIIIVRKIEYFE